MSQTAADYRLRTFDPAQDIPKMVQLRIEIEEADQVGADTSEASLRAQFNYPGQDPTSDRWVVEAEGAEGFIGYAWTFAQSPMRSINHVAVHPAWRRQGIGTALMQAAIARARVKGTAQVVSGRIAKLEGSHAFLTLHGYQPVGNNRFFIAPANTIVDKPVWPVGFTMKSLTELDGDLEPVVRASNACYADMWGHRENTELLTVTYLQETMTRFAGSYDPAGIFVLFAPDGDVAGLCFSRVEKGTTLGYSIPSA